MGAITSVMAVVTILALFAPDARAQSGRAGTEAAMAGRGPGTAAKPTAASGDAAKAASGAETRITAGAERRPRVHHRFFRHHGRPYRHRTCWPDHDDRSQCRYY